MCITFKLKEPHVFNSIQISSYSFGRLYSICISLMNLQPSNILGVGSGIGFNMPTEKAIA